MTWNMLGSRHRAIRRGVGHACDRNLSHDLLHTLRERIPSLLTSLVQQLRSRQLKFKLRSVASLTSITNNVSS